MSMKDVAVRIVERYFLGPREEIVEVRAWGNHVDVSSRYCSWDVQPVEKFRIIDRSAGYDLYGIENAAGTYYQVAVLPDDRMFYLEDKKELRAFFEAAHRLLAPLEVAALLALNQTEHAENIIVDFNKLPMWFYEEDIAAYAPRLPVVTTREDGAMSVDFDTMFTSYKDGDRENLNRWHVELSATGQISWKIEAIAKDLESPFFSRKRRTDTSKGS